MKTDSERRRGARGRQARRLQRLLASSAYVTLLACSDDHTGPQRVAAINVSPTVVDTLVAGESRQLSALPVTAAGKALHGRVITWTSVDPSIASVSSSGNVTGVAPGQTTIVVASEGAAATVSVTVISPNGELEISVETVGHGIDPNGYVLIVDGTPIASPLARSDQRTIPLIRGMHSVGLDNLDPPCALSPAQSQTAFVFAGQRQHMGFTVQCLLNGTLVVQTQTTIAGNVPNPYQLTIGASTRALVAPNGEAQFPLQPGLYQIAISASDLNCDIDQATQQTRVEEETSVRVIFMVTCHAYQPPSAGAKLLVTSMPSSAGGSSVIEMVDLDGTHRRQLTADGVDSQGPALSPDGTRLAFVRFSAASYHSLALLDLTTGQETVPPGLVINGTPQWMPDGQHLVVNVGGAVAMQRLDGAVERVLFPGNDFGEPHLSPDGKKITVKRGNGILIGNVDGSDLHALAASAVRNFQGGAWSRDGTQILVESDSLRGCYPYYYYYYPCQPTNRRLFIFRAATGIEVASYTVPADAYGFVWGQTNNEVYFVRVGAVYQAKLPRFDIVNVTRSSRWEHTVAFGVVSDLIPATQLGVRSRTR